MQAARLASRVNVLTRMKANVGRRERLARIGFGVAMLAWAARARTAPPWRRWLLGVLGVANVATAVTRYCPSNALLGVDNTRGDELVHFVTSRRRRRGRLGRRLNKLQRRLHAQW